MMQYQLGFRPELPELPEFALAIIIAIAIFTALTVLIFTRQAGILRLIAIAMLVFALFEPYIIAEQTKPIKSTVIAIIDKSESQSLGERARQTEEISEQIKQSIENIDEFELRLVEYQPNNYSAQSDISTALLQALSNAVQDLAPSNIAGAVFVTDGQVHDASQQLLESIGGTYPIHALISGEENEFDRKITLQSAPRFSLVDQPITISYIIEDDGTPSSNNSASKQAIVEFWLNGELLAKQQAPIGVATQFEFILGVEGTSSMQILVEPQKDELSTINNSKVLQIDGVRENLKVLLISGEPHPGERTWRSLLKSDISVDLVHFTILRPPEKNDGTPINELSLIAFPTRELFVDKIDSFDLLVFDRYQNRSVLPSLYFDFIAQYVMRGGAVLIAAGPEFSSEASLASTSLAQILPALPNGQIDTELFRPQITDLGFSHPITKDLAGANSSNSPAQWGRWGRLIGAQQYSGQTLMSDEANRPLLSIDEIGEGRVALFLSDHPWLWSRGFDGGGPHVQLLRRITHWLLKQPQLEAEALTTKFENGILSVQRQTLSDELNEIAITKPNGEIIQSKPSKIASGKWQYDIEQPALGFWQFDQDNLRASTHIGPTNPAEFKNIVSTTQILEKITSKRDGITSRLTDQPPSFVAFSGNGASYGENWLGFRDTKQSQIIGSKSIPLAQGLLALALMLFVLAGAWYREGK